MNIKSRIALALLGAVLSVTGLANGTPVFQQPRGVWTDAAAPRTDPHDGPQDDRSAVRGRPDRWNTQLGVWGLTPLEGDVGERTYRWIGDNLSAPPTLIELRIRGDRARLRVQGQAEAVETDAAAFEPFERLLAGSEFMTRHENGTMGLDECRDQVFEAIINGLYHSVQNGCGWFELRGLRDALWELEEMTHALQGQVAAPLPYWSPQEGPRPAPAFAQGCSEEGCRSAWVALLQSLDLPELAQQRDDRAYRLILFPHSGPAQVITIQLDFDRNHWLRRIPPGVFPFETDHYEPNRMTVTSTARRGSRRQYVEMGRAEFELGLRRGRFALLESELAPRPCQGPSCVTGACPGPPSWVLEAATHGRYRFVVGSACDRRGLDAALREITRAGGVQAWP